MNTTINNHAAELDGFVANCAADLSMPIACAVG